MLNDLKNIKKLSGGYELVDYSSFYQ